VEKIRAFAHFASTTLASAKSSDSFIQRSLFFPPSSCPFHPMSSFLKKLTARNSTVSALMLFLRRQKKRRQERKGRVISIENKKNSTSTLPPPLCSTLFYSEPRCLGDRRGHSLHRVGPPRAAEGEGTGGSQGPGAARGGGERPELETKGAGRKRPRFPDPGPADRGAERGKPKEAIDR